MRFKQKITGKNGFTIVELLVVIVVIGILATISIVSYGAWKKQAATAQVKSDLNGVAAAMESARTFANAYPATIPTTFTASTGVTLTGGSADGGKTYCVDGASTSNLTIVYYVDSTASDKGAQAGTCATRPNLPAPGIPSNLASASFISTSISLSWSAVSGAANYTAQCAYDPGFINGLQQSTQSSTNTVLNGFTPSTIYCRVKALNNTGSSNWSPSIAVTASTQSGLVAWYPFNGNAQDTSGNGYNGTVNGASLTYGIEGTPNSAYSFNGTSNRISLPDSAAITGNSPYTLSAWIRATDINAGDGIIGWGAWGTVNGVTAFRTQNESGIIGLRTYWWNNDLAASASFITNGSWHHALTEFDGTTRRTYIDGVLVSYDSPTGHNAVASDVNIGRTDVIEYFTGSIDDVRIYNRALSASEVSGLYAAYAPQSILNGMVGWWPLNGNANDASGNGNNGTVSGATLTTGANGASNGAYSFSGTGSGVSIGNPLALQIPAGGAVTMCAWVNPSTTGGWYGIMAKRSASYDYAINYMSSSPLQVYTSGSSGVVQFSNTPPVGVWTHICGVISSAPSALYINGSSAGVAGTGGGVANNGNSFTIGASGTAGESFPGKIDDVRIYGRALTASEISSLYSAGAQ